MQLLQAIKNGLLPPGMAVRQIPFGIASGVYLRLDFRRHTKLWLGLYETELAPYYHELIRPGMSCFDVGGDIGYSALLIAKLCQSRVVSFECVPDAVRTMQESFAANPAYNIQIIQSFVGDTNDDTHITLDEATNRTFVPDFIKMDIEGAEAAALKGSPRLLTDRQPHIIIETHGKSVEEECIAILRQHGYAPQIVDQRSGLFKEDRPLTHNRWLICRGRGR
jgi:hypothetical protein